MINYSRRLLVLLVQRLFTRFTVRSVQGLTGNVIDKNDPKLKTVEFFKHFEKEENHVLRVCRGFKGTDGIDMFSRSITTVIIRIHFVRVILSGF